MNEHIATRDEDAVAEVLVNVDELRTALGNLRVNRMHARRWNLDVFICVKLTTAIEKLLSEHGRGNGHRPEVSDSLGYLIDYLFK
jgi:hypothetical protein